MSHATRRDACSPPHRVTIHRSRDENRKVKDVMHTVRIRDVGKDITVGEGQSILDAALENGIDYPCGCEIGACGACKSLLISGAVDFLPYTKSVLPQAERDGGLILACCAVPRSDCEVTFAAEAVHQEALPPVREFIAHVAGIEDATHDIKIVRLVAPELADFTFLAGQFATLTFDGIGGREYSMASLAGAPLLEFHIRRVPGGRVSGHVHDRLRVGDAVTVRGPLGTAYHRADHQGPLIALAGGSGLAPIKAIVERALAVHPDQRIDVYFGARDEADIYLEDHFAALARTHTNLRYVPVLSEPGDASPRRTGFLADAVAADFTALDGAKAYLAGPPIMVETCEAVLERLGVGPGDRHADAFVTRPPRDEKRPVQTQRAGGG